MPGRRLALLVGASALALFLAPVGSASAATQQTCTGTPQNPGVLSGTYNSNVVVQGACQVSAGPAVINGNLTVSGGSVLLAQFSNADLTVNGNLTVWVGATAFLGCDPQSSPCIDDPDPNNPTQFAALTVSGDVLGQQPLGLIVHNATVNGNYTQTGGGGGLTCDPVGIFALFGSPAFSTIEDSTVDGSVTVTRLKSCWLGLIRLQVGRNVVVQNNRLLDPDAIEINDNHISGSLICISNSMVWDSAEIGDGLFPRAPEPNTVDGRRIGQCVLSSPTEPEGPRGPGPF
jgi:hypothetical protein